MVADCGNVLEDVNVVVNNSGMSVALVMRINADTQQALPLATGNGESSCRGEASNNRDRDEVNEEAELQETTEENDDTGEKAEEDSVLWSILSVDTGH